jgi:hypothetical protein
MELAIFIAYVQAAFGPGRAGYYNPQWCRATDSRIYPDVSGQWKPGLLLNPLVSFAAGQHRLYFPSGSPLCRAEVYRSRCRSRPRLATGQHRCCITSRSRPRAGQQLWLVFAQPRAWVRSRVCSSTCTANLLLRLFVGRFRRQGRRQLFMVTASWRRSCRSRPAVR